MRTPRLHDSALMRTAFLVLGGIALLLGVVGIFLPVLPTTPFVLLAAGCFARGSTRLHDGLLANRTVGPVIRAWHEHRSMPPGVKPFAFLMMTLSFGASIAVMESPWHRIMLVFMATVLTILLWRVPVRKRGDDAGRSPASPS